MTQGRDDTHGKNLVLDAGLTWMKKQTNQRVKDMDVHQAQNLQQGTKQNQERPTNFT